MTHTHKLIDGVRVDLTAEEIAELNARDEIENKKITDAKAIYDAANAEENNQAVKPYIAKRKAAYPPIGDQLDYLWHSIDESAELKQKYFSFYEAIKAVKAKYPK